MACFYNGTRRAFVRLITVCVAAAFFFGAMATTPVQATTYGFLTKAIREYHDNPNPETEAALNRASTKAMALDYGMIGVPIIIVILRFVLRRGGEPEKLRCCR